MINGKFLFIFLKLTYVQDNRGTQFTFVLQIMKPV
jgi:hypothetical protein